MSDSCTHHWQIAGGLAASTWTCRLCAAVKVVPWSPDAGPRNKSGARPKTKKPYVTYSQKSQMWEARKAGGKYLGLFATREEAEAASGREKVR